MEAILPMEIELRLWVSASYCISSISDSIKWRGVNKKNFFLRLLSYPCIPHQTSLSLTTGAVFLALLAFLLIAIKQRNSIMLWSFSLAIIPFIPSSNLFFPIGTILAERLLYLPSMGFCLMSGVAMAGLVDRSDQTKSQSKHKLTPNKNGMVPIAESVYLLIICSLSVGSRFVSVDSIAKMCALYDKVWRKSHHKRVQFCSRMNIIAKGLLFITLCAYMGLMSMKTVQRCNQWSSEGKLFASALHGACPRSLKVGSSSLFKQPVSCCRANPVTSSPIGPQ